MFRYIFSASAIAIAVLTSAIAHGQSQSSSHGQSIFRFDTFGDEQLWTDTLRMQDAISNVSPRTALSVGLKVDSEALPPALINAIKAGQVNLDDPAVTIQLLKLNAVIGVIGRVIDRDMLKTVGITCALCHTQVDNSVAPGPGKFDPRLQYFNGTSIVPLNSPTLPVVIAPAFGLQGVKFETFTGDGPISYWNNYVGVTQMGGHGSFSDARVAISVTQKPDQVTS